MMEPVEIIESDSDDDECDGERCGLPYVDVELGSVPIVPLETPDWLKINRSDTADTESESPPSSICEPQSDNDEVAPRTTVPHPRKRKVSFCETTDVYLIPLPSPEEKRARFYTLDQIAQFRLEAERAMMKQYIEQLMDRPCSNPFKSSSQDQQDEEQEKRPIHHSKRQQDLSHLPETKEDCDHPDDVVKVAATRPQRYATQVKQHSLHLVAGMCILAYIYSNC